MFARSLAVLGPVVALMAAAGAGTIPAPAGAASGCSGTAGTIVVVDFNQLGSGGSDIVKGCAPSADSAATAFGQAGFDLTYSPAPGMQGYVCTVEARPADRDCTGADSYWSLWWSDGKGGPWVYSSLGVTSLDAPKGGYVAFSWHEGAGTRGTSPGVNPTRRVAAPAPSPTPDPTPQGGKGNGGSTGGSGGAHGSSPSASPSASASTTTSTSPSASASPSDKASVKDAKGDATSAAATESSESALPEIDEISEAPPAAEPKDDGGGFPAWVGIGLAVLVLGAAGAVPIIRRRAG